MYVEKGSARTVYVFIRLWRNAGRELLQSRVQYGKYFWPSSNCQLMPNWMPRVKLRL